ncbi:hypothetical protein HY971_02770 [Candidatus Kaiserbacteria bacterium]|nr:hypothetical protein [Candidatus Kaiserbacteria bacterium]
MTDKSDTQAILKKRFTELPKVVQNAITSADVRKHMRELADTHKLHLDQWEMLENEVMMTLFGILPVDELQTNIQKQVGVSKEIAEKLTENISKIVFEPIREELERELEHPDAKAAEVSGVEAARTQMLGGTAAPAPTVLPATPPAAAPMGKIERAPISAAYKAGEPSTARKSIEDDPYREPPA